MSASARKTPKSLSGFVGKQSFQTVFYNSNDRFRQNDDRLKDPDFSGQKLHFGNGRITNLVQTLV
jgi:hypothetical protein